MIAYLFYSSISLALLLVVYRVFLEKEKRFTFNRVFLLWSLVFSFLIPVIPVGLAPIEIPWSAFFSSGETVSVTYYQNLEGLIPDSEVQTIAIENNDAAISSETLFTIAFLLYISIAALLFIKLIRIINKIQLTIRRNPKRIIQGCEVVFLNKNVIPHTFINTVFLSKKQFERGEIPKEVLNHEFAHVRQKHSLDILFVEFLKIIFWFNPLLYFYKHAIALNHEYLADEAVLSKGTVIKNYQRLLLKTMEGSTIYGLASSFNFSLTKRRLQMMNQSKTRMRFLIKLAMLAPLFAGLSLLLGCEPASNETLADIDTPDEIRIEILEDNAMLVNENPMTLDELERLLSEIPESPGLVNMKVSPNAEFGMVTDVQSILRKYKAFRINYSSTKNSDLITEEERAKIDEAGKIHQQQYEAYMNLDPETTSLEELESAYEKVTEAADEINRVFKKIAGDDTPPPPLKLGPTPEKRKLINSPEVLELKSKMDEALKNLGLKTRAYLNIEPIESSSEKLKASYNEIMESLTNFGDAQNVYYNSIGKQVPPLPPIPPKPEDRIKNN